MTKTGPWTILAGGILALLATAALRPAPVGFWAPEGFVEQADTLVRRGVLELRCGDQDSIVVRARPGSPEEEFFDASYLRSDVRAFNRSPDAIRSPFLVEGCRLVGVDPFYHRVDLPYNRLPRWRGSVLFTFDGRTATLEGGAGQELELRQPVDRSDAARGAQWVSPTREDAKLHTPLLHFTGPGGREVLADVFFVGPDPVVVDRRDVGSGDALRVNGFRTPPGRMVRLGSGDWLQLVDGSGEGDGASGGPWTYVVETGDRARTASLVRVRNERVDRLFPAERLEPLLRPFGQAMDLALHTIPGAASSGIVDADVRLTLDRELSDALDARLEEWCRDFPHPTRPRAASLLVMDAFSGAVRAMPSCPGREELAPFEPLSTRTHARYLRNQNLVAHPVGSAAKPFWAAAIATTWPNFLDFRIEPHEAGPTSTVLGCPLRVPYGDGHGSPEWTGLEAFLQRSCNRYQVELATAALALGSERTGPECRGPLAPADFVRCFPDPLRTRVAAGVSGGATSLGRDTVSTGRVRFCDAVVNTVLAPGMDVVGGRCDDLQLVDAAFDPGPTLQRLANVSVYRDPSPATVGDGRAPALGDQYRLGRYRVDAWRHVLGELEAAGDTAHLARTALRFSGVSPRAANLALNTVEELRTDWVNLLLGGENSRWSNFELAEATARLMTGRAVRGMLADRFGSTTAGVGSGLGEAPPPLPGDALHSGVRRRVLHAMERVVGPGGTAGRLSPAIGRLEARLREIDPGTPYDVWVFAKTGTPAVEKFDAEQGRVDRRGGVVLLGILAAPSAEGRRRAVGVDDWIAACRLAPELRRGILEVPPAETLDPERAVGVTAAVYLDDLAPEQGSGRAVELVSRVFDDLGGHIEKEIRRKLAR